MFRYRILIAIMVVVMTGLLFIVAASPASADQPDVHVDSVDLSTCAAGADDVSCNITITANESIDVGDVLTFEFTGFDLSDMDLEVDDSDKYKHFRWDDGVGDNLIHIGDLLVSENQITFYAGAPIANGIQATLMILPEARLGNPDISQEIDGDCCDQNAACNCAVNGGDCGDAAPTSPYEVAVNGDDMNVYIYDQVSVDGTSFAKGDTATITATGFSPESTLYVTGGFSGSGVVGANGTVVIDCIVTGAQIPLYAQDTFGRKACMDWAGNFNLLPSLQISPDEGTICTPVIIKGYNYPVEPDEITIGGVPMYTGPIFLQDLDSDACDDDFRIVNIPIPRSLKGAKYQIVAGNGTTYFTVENQQVTISPAAGPPGTIITIEGSGFCPGDGSGAAIMMYGSTTLGEYVTPVPFLVDDNGDFTTFGKVPKAAPSGVHGILVFFNPYNPGVFDPMQPDQVYCQGIFTVTDRELTMVPDNIPFGSVAVLSGGDFGSEAAGQTPELWVNYQRMYLPAIDSQQLTSNGYLVPATFRITKNLNFHYGENVVEVRTLVEGEPRSSSTTFEVVRPTLEIDPGMGGRGTLVTVTGASWPTEADSHVTVSYNRVDTMGTEVVDVVEPDDEGDIWTQFIVPPFEMAADEEIYLMIQAEDNYDNESLQQVFVVTPPAIEVSPPLAQAGDDITVTGTGFMPKFPVMEVSIEGALILPEYELPLTDSQGGFEVSGRVPGVAPGIHMVEARVTQPYGEPVTCLLSIDGNFQPGTPSGSPQITITPQSGNADDGVTVKGVHFMPLAQIQEVSVDQAPIIDPRELGLTSGTGSFTITGTVPGIIPGSHSARARVTQWPTNPVTCTFSVLGDTVPGTPAGVPHIEVTPDHESAGFDVTVKGTHFALLSQVCEVSIGNYPIVPVYELPISSATGSFSITGKVPEVMEGGHVVQARVTQPPEAAITCPFVVTGGQGSTAIEAAFETIAGLYTYIWTYDAGTGQWIGFKPGLPSWVPTIQQPNAGQGYWIFVTEDCTLVYGASSWNFTAGWNLFGWMG